MDFYKCKFKNMRTKNIYLTVSLMILLFGSLDIFAQGGANISNLFPLRNANAASTSGNIIITADQPFSDNEVTKSSIAVFSQRAGGKKAGRVSINGNTLSFDPAVDFKPGEKIFVTIGRGSGLAKAEVYQFTTAAVPVQGGFCPQTIPSNRRDINNVFGADTDGDGQLEIVSAGTAALAVADINRDGSLETLITEIGPFGSVREYLGGFNYLVSRNPVSLALADLDGDGDLDFMTADREANNVSIRLYPVRPGDLSGRSILPVGLEPLDVAAADLDSDGDMDILAANSASGMVSIWLNNGSASFSAGNDVAVGVNPNRIETADLDGDGDLDILTSNAGSNSVSVRLNDGSGNFITAREVPVGLNPVGVNAADIDADGDLDILAPNRGGNGSVSLRVNDGAGAFSGDEELAVGQTPNDIDVADMNGDGYLDILTSQSNRFTVIYKTPFATSVTAANVFANLDSTSVTLTATVSATCAGGRVQFFIDNISVGSTPIVDGRAKLNIPTTGLKTKTYIIKANYLGDGTYLPSTSDPLRNGIMKVNKKNLPPTANAGPDQYLRPQTTNTILNGSGSDPEDGNNVSFRWIQISGPSIARLNHSDAATMQVYDLKAGTYDFCLIVTDQQKATDADHVIVSVQPGFVDSILSFTLIDADKQQAIRQLNDGDVLDLAILPTVHLNIRANPKGGVVDNVAIVLSGTETRNVNADNPPYTLFGYDYDENLYNSWTPAIGPYTLWAQPFGPPGGGYALQINFTVINSAPLSTTDPGIHLSSFPNPAGKQAVFSFSTPQNESRVTLNLYDLSGKVISRVYDGKADAHQQFKFNFDGSSLSPGVYLLRLNTLKSAKSFKVIMNQ